MLPVAYIQPRNRIPLWARAWRRSWLTWVGRQPTVWRVTAAGGLTIFVAWAVILPCLYAYRWWDGAPPKVQA